jgi:DNA-binding transcriptional LysR family regulator
MDKRPSIDPRALLTFRTVCREGSISAAARVLNIAQPSVSAAIAQLEARLGVQLFERHQTGVRPTSEGALLAERAEAMHHVLVGAQEELDNQARGLAGPLRIGGTPGALVSLLPFVIGRLEARIGPCALSVVERPDGVLVDLLRQRQIDLAFVTTEIEAPPPISPSAPLPAIPLPSWSGGATMRCLRPCRCATWRRCHGCCPRRRARSAARWMRCSSPRRRRCRPTWCAAIRC